MDFSKLQYQFFGSKDSVDYDIMVIVDKIPSDIKSCHDLIKNLNDYYSTIYTDKKINCNLATVTEYMGNTVLQDVFKGTHDECNNSMFYTYANHKQPSIENIITIPIDRSIDLKFKRVARFILTFFSRDEELRTEIKHALKSDDLRVRLKVIEKIDFRKYVNYDFKKKEDPKDIWKVIAFQLCQTSLLFIGIEAYTKKDCETVGLLNNFLYRKELTDQDFELLMWAKDIYITQCHTLMETMTHFSEAIHRQYK